MEGLRHITRRIQFKNKYRHPSWLRLASLTLKATGLPEYCTRLVGLAKRVWICPKGNIIERLEKVTGHIGKTTYRITGFRQHQFSKTLTIAIILLRNRKCVHQDMSFVRIKSFFYILKNVGQGITNPLNFLSLIILIVNTSINSDS